MKKFVSVLCVAALSCSIASSVMAAPSIGPIVPYDPVVSESVFPEGSKVVFTVANADSYKSELAKKAVKYFNENPEPKYMKEFLEICGLDPEGEFKTTDGDEFDPGDYEFISAFSDLALEQDGENTYDFDLEEDMTLTFRSDVVKGTEAENLLICQIDDAAEEVLWIPVDEIDPVAGKVTADFPAFGPFAILEKTAHAE